MKQSLLNRLYEFIKDRYSLPEEARPHVTKRNVKLASIILKILIGFSTTLFVIICLLKTTDLRIYLYYTGMFVISLTALLVLKLLSKKNSYYSIQTYLMVVLCFVLALLVFNIIYSTAYAYVSGLITIYIFHLLIIICFDITPLFHIIAVILFAVIFGYYSAKNNLYISNLVNNTLFCFCIIVLSLYKRSSLVKRNKQRQQIKEQNKMLEISNIELELQKNSLLANKKNLEGYVYVQSKELQQQNAKIIRIQNNTIVSLSSLVENRDEDTGDHVLRTRDYVELIATKAQQSGKFPELTESVKKLYVKAAPMHDIGKIVVPDSVLKKPGRLTPEEFELIKLHTTKGGEIVENVLGAAEDAEYVKTTKEIATYHHEKYDGTGYPKGLKGKEIPLSARIMAIADVYDALVSPRCYKKQMSEEEAFKIISESAGKHFDPELAQFFIDAKDEIIAIHNKYI